MLIEWIIKTCSQLHYYMTSEPLNGIQICNRLGSLSSLVDANRISFYFTTRLKQSINNGKLAKAKYYFIGKCYTLNTFNLRSQNRYSFHSLLDKI